jgi:hypothetical protein
MPLTLTSVWVWLTCHRRDEHDFPMFHSFGLHISPFPYSFLFGSLHAHSAQGHDHLLCELCSRPAKRGYCMHAADPSSDVLVCS